MAMRKKSIFKTVMIWLLLLLLLVGGIGAVCYFAGIGKDDITDIVKPTFRIEYDGRIYKTTTENLIDLPCDGQAVIKVKNGGQYSVKVSPFATYSFTMNGEKRLLDKSEDITEFLINGSEVLSDYFIMNCDGILLQKAIKKMCGSSNEYVFSGNANDFCLNLFITSETGELITVKLTQTGVTGVFLDQYGITF